MSAEFLYAAGLAAGLVYLLGDIIGGFITPDYSYIRNAVSELIQSGAEHRWLLSPFMFIHAILIILFSVAIVTQHPFSLSKPIFLGGILLLIVGMSHALSSTVFPMDPVGSAATLPGRLHLVLVAATVLSIFALMPLIGLGYYWLAGWRSFLIFTLLSLGIIVVSGAASPIVISRGIPVMGLTERITAYTFYLWLFLLALLLIWDQIGIPWTTN